MLEQVSRYLVDRTIESNIVSKDDEELYLYSFQSLIAHIASLLSLAIIGIIFGCFIETVVFMVLFTPLRIYSGGFHQGSYLSCYISSLFLFAGIVALCKLVVGHTPLVVIVICVVISAAVIFLLAPIADENKPLDADETNKYKKVARLILMAELVIFTVFLLCGLDMRFLSFVAASPVTVAVLLLASVVQHKVQSFES